jgi:hypothetical protein
VRRSSGSCESPWDSFELRCFVDVGTLSRGQRKNSMYIKEDGSFLDIEPSCSVMNMSVLRLILLPPRTCAAASVSRVRLFPCRPTAK